MRRESKFVLARVRVRVCACASVCPRLPVCVWERRGCLVVGELRWKGEKLSTAPLFRKEELLRVS